MALEAVARAAVSYGEGSQPDAGSLCPHHSHGLPEPGRGERSSAGSVIDVSLSDLTAVAEQRGTRPGVPRHNARGGAGRDCDSSGNGGTGSSRPASGLLRTSAPRTQRACGSVQPRAPLRADA